MMYFTLLFEKIDNDLKTLDSLEEEMSSPIYTLLVGMWADLTFLKHGLIMHIQMSDIHLPCPSNLTSRNLL